MCFHLTNSATYAILKCKDSALSHAVGSTSTTYNYTYDNGGNITSKKEQTLTSSGSVIGNATIYSYAYDNKWKDKLISFNGQTCAYDLLGNPTTYRGNTLTWTHVRRLASYGTNTYTYGADSIRTSKTINGITTTYTLDGNKILKETDETKTLIYYYGNDGVIGFKYNNADYYYEKNLQGDVIAIYNARGTKVASYVYDAWGKNLNVTNYTAESIGSINPFRYRSYYYDVENGLYYLEARYYDPEVARFISAEEIIAPSCRLNSHNLYAYCYNEPVGTRVPSVERGNGVPTRSINNTSLVQNATNAPNSEHTVSQSPAEDVTTNVSEPLAFLAMLAVYCYMSQEIIKQTIQNLVGYELNCTKNENVDHIPLTPLAYWEKGTIISNTICGDNDKFLVLSGELTFGENNSLGFNGGVRINAGNFSCSGSIGTSGANLSLSHHDATVGITVSVEKIALTVSKKDEKDSSKSYYSELGFNTIPLLFAVAVVCGLGYLMGGGGAIVGLALIAI